MGEEGRRKRKKEKRKRREEREDKKREGVPNLLFYNLITACKVIRGGNRALFTN